MSSLYLLRVGAPFIVGLLQIGLAIAIYRKKRGQDASNNLFALVIVSVALWDISLTLFNLSPVFGHAYFFSTFTYFAASLIPYFFFLFTLNFPLERFRITKKELFLITIPFCVAMIFILVPHKVVQEVQQTSFENSVFVAGTGYFTYAVFLTGYFLLAFVNLFRKYHTTTGVLKKQVVHLFFGTLIPTLVGVITDLFFVVFVSLSYNWVGPVSTLLLFILITYSMRRYKLFDIKILEYKNKLLALLPPDEAKKITLFDARRHVIIGKSAG